MIREDFKEYLGKGVSITLKTNYFYSGTIQELKNGFLVFIDKYDSKMKISYDSIANISEKKRGF